MAVYCIVLYCMIALGHGDSNGKNLPTLVKDVSGIGQVSCGSVLYCIV